MIDLQVAEGTIGADGADGDIGATGAAGAIGADGAAGADGAVGGALDPTIADHEGSGITLAGTAGEPVVAGSLLYMGSDGRWAETDADAAATTPGTGIALGAASENEDVEILILGLFRDDTYDWTPGAILYASTTPGAITVTAPSGSGDQIQVVAIAITADIILFNPDHTMIELT